MTKLNAMYTINAQINDLTFLNMYFNIIFFELTLLRFNKILRIILSNRQTFVFLYDFLLLAGLNCIFL